VRALVRSLLVGLLAVVLVPASARGAFVDPTAAGIEILNAAGEPETRAGAHPDRMIAKFAFTKGPNGRPEENLKDVSVDLPRGFLGNPLAVPYCPRGKLFFEECPMDSQVGVARLSLDLLGEPEVPLFNVEPAGDELAEVSFSVVILQGRFRISLRPDDGGMRLEVSDFTEEIPMLESEIELWGVPFDHQQEPSLPRRAFLSLPTSCGPLPAAVLGTRTWERPTVWETTPLPLPSLGGCSGLPFSPAIAFAPSSFEADSPTGLELSLQMPQDEDPDGVTSDQPRSLTVTLPRGFSLSPALAAGLLSCSEAQLHQGTDIPAECPAAAGIGSVRIQSPALAGELDGRVYLAPVVAGRPFRAFVVAERPGLRIKLPVELRTDAAGTLTAELTDMPQLPLSNLSIAFDGGPRALLASPQTCGNGTLQGTLRTYGGHSAMVSARVLTANAPGGAPCGHGRPFAPSLSAGSTSPGAGRSSGFSITLRRRDGEQTLAGMRIQMPAGLVARIAGVPRCPERAIVAAGCPAASRIGSTMIEAGAGPAPLAVGGDVYLTGPSGGAPFGLAILVPISAGPFQLGTAVIRAALSINPESGQLTIATEPLPSVVGGIPLRIRTIGIDLDRPGFIRNPTSCVAGSVRAEVTSAEGATATPSAPFQVRGCGRLRFAPRVSLSLLDASSRQPGLRIGVHLGGRANLSSLSIRLPAILRNNPGLAAVACPLELFRLRACPPASLLGKARARTPLLRGNLGGPVHLVQATAVGPPQLWTELRGDGVLLVTKTVTAAAASGRLITRVRGLPDFPLSSLTTTLRSGPQSPFRTAAPVCRGARPLAEVSAAAHSGALATQVVPLLSRRNC
jgi:hypothetical protein